MTLRVPALLAGLGLFLFAAPAHAAGLYFSPAAGSYRQNENFTVAVLVSADAPISAIQGTVTFPTEYLEALEIVRNGMNSIVDLWVEKPSLSNFGESGNVSFAGVVLNPGFAGPSGKIIEIVFRAKKSGSATLAFTDFAVLANDGLGTDVATLGGAGNLTLLPPRQVPPESRETPGSARDLNVITKKIVSLEEELERIGAPSASGVLAIWDVLPRWIQLSVLLLMGAAALVLSLIVLSLGIVVLFWFWSHAWYRKDDLARWFRHAALRMRRLVRSALVFVRLSERELAGDVHYAAKELRRDVEEAKEYPTTFGKIFRNYWVSIGRIVKRFLSRNSKETRRLP